MNWKRTQMPANQCVPAPAPVEGEMPFLSIRAVKGGALLSTHQYGGPEEVVTTPAEIKAAVAAWIEASTLG